MDQFLKKVNSAIKFKQSTWLKPYISLISKYRAKLKMDFEKNQNKFFNSSVFDKKSKMIENKEMCNSLLMKNKKKDSLLQETLREVNMYQIFLEYFE